MRCLGSVAAAAIVMAATVPAANAADVIQVVNYTPGAPDNFIGSVVRGPGRYRFQIDTTSPLLYLSGSADKTFNFDFFCDFGDGVVACGGDDYPISSPFVQTSPLRYTAEVTVTALYSVPENDAPFVRTDYHDTCCNYIVDFEGLRSGTATLSVTALPEPRTWALLIIGFGAVGMAMRAQADRRRMMIRYT